jgi:hypothetical protein
LSNVSEALLGGGDRLPILVQGGLVCLLGGGDGEPILGHHRVAGLLGLGELLAVRGATGGRRRCRGGSAGRRARAGGRRAGGAGPRVGHQRVLRDGVRGQLGLRLLDRRVGGTLVGGQLVLRVLRVLHGAGLRLLVRVALVPGVVHAGSRVVDALLRLVDGGLVLLALHVVGPERA